MTDHIGDVNDGEARTVPCGYARRFRGSVARSAMPEYTIGPPMIYIPVLQRAADYKGWTDLPLGYVQVDELAECPICVEEEQCEQ